MTKKNTDASSVAQRVSFIETAHKFGCDESEVAFEGKLRKIASSKPKPEYKTKGKVK